MLNHLTLQLLCLVVLVTFIIANRFEWFNPQWVLLGLFIAVLIFSAISVWSLLSAAIQMYKHTFILSAARAISLVLSLLVLLFVGAILLKIQQSPPIHDISTDTHSPPVFEYTQSIRQDFHNSLEYKADNVAYQQQAYPHIQSLSFAIAPEALLPKIEKLMIAQGWSIHGINYQQATIEAYDKTPLLGFTDDIVIRVQPHAGGSLVDIRSVSRIGVSDLGANARRIEDFTDQLQAIID